MVLQTSDAFKYANAASIVSSISLHLREHWKNEDPFLIRQIISGFI